MHLLLTRPRADAEETLAALEARGHQVWLEPLLEIQPRERAALDLEGVQGLVITSRNGLRAYLEACPRRDLPVYAVGPASAEAARQAGFAEVQSADGDAVKLAALIQRQVDPAAGALLHPSGRDVAGALGARLEAAGYDLRRVVLYEARAARALSPATSGLLRGGTLNAVLLFSPRTAETFARLVKQEELASACAGLQAFCLSPAVAAAAGSFWQAVHTAEKPNQAAMLALIDGMDPGTGEQESGKGSR
ncbi:uroporphyrinogen-III synthase [Fodinicurvata fenggangensis]|uniref:uroporphyrinogen-III synthase n=1 Tax=Fodinicurvata fenggangensis TaxID=1121830 RepID=UPI00068BFF7A|nr:uroporphyrinogen-III synthase [Fodinicurvata fenggangensis]